MFEFFLMHIHSLNPDTPTLNEKCFDLSIRVQ